MRHALKIGDMVVESVRSTFPGQREMIHVAPITKVTKAGIISVRHTRFRGDDFPIYPVSRSPNYQHKLLRRATDADIKEFEAKLILRQQQRAQANGSTQGELRERADELLRSLGLSPNPDSVGKVLDAMTWAQSR